MTQCWVLTEGLIGTQNQCVALANAIGLIPEIKTVHLKQPWKTVTPWIRHFSPRTLAENSSPLRGPWPDLLIASGRKAIAAALWIKTQSGNRTKLVIVQSPVIKSRRFDLVIVPQHDNYRAPNALQTDGALSVITPETLADAHAEWADRLGSYHTPRLAVLIGGTSRTHRFTDTIITHFIAQLMELAKTHSLFITASRRTPAAYLAQVREALHGPNILFWDGNGENPYRGFLAWADALIVTEDSVSMASEAISTGKPVYILKMDGESRRFSRFHTNLINKHYARWFTGPVENWVYAPPADLSRAAAAVQALLK